MASFLAAAGTWLLFDRDNALDRERKLDVTRKQATQRDPQLRCAECGLVITHPKERLAIQGGYEHDFSNPLGVSFHIGCFAKAPGCTQHGEPTLEWTWFAGFHWQVALCRQCRAHLGWFFHSVDNSFYGLILERLRMSDGISE